MKRTIILLTASILLATLGLFAQQVTYSKVLHQADTVADPQLVTVSNAVVTLFSTNDSRTAYRTIMRVVQNVGTNPVLYTINSTNVATTNYHGVIAGGQVARDGLGSVADFSRVPWPISFKCEAGSTVLSLIDMNQQ